MAIFHKNEDLLCVLNAPPLPVTDMVLHFHRWSRLNMAKSEATRYRAMVKICGLPSHTC
jgi:hypothetical protein